VICSETEKLHRRVQEVILSQKKISHIPWVDSASLLQYGPKLLFALVMMLSTKAPIMISMSNLSPHFLFVVYLLEGVEQAVSLVMLL
jgi:hypothetical protein